VRQRRAQGDQAESGAHPIPPPVLTRRAAGEVWQVVHAQACGDFAQASSARCEEAAQQAAFAELAV
jgi:hypothetical protein